MKAPNVILLTVDCLRADHVGALGCDLGLTPALDSLAGDSLVFRQAFATGPITPHAFPGLLTSTYPLDYQGPLQIDRPRVLASEVFQRNGYVTAGFSSNPFVSRYFGYDRGWDYFDEGRRPVELAAANRSRAMQARLRASQALKGLLLQLHPDAFFAASYLYFRANRARWAKMRANLMNATVKDFLLASLNQDRPVFAWAHYMDVHSPYFSADERRAEAPPSYEVVGWSRFGNLQPSYWPNQRIRRAASRFRDGAARRYRQEIQYVDDQLGELMDFLKSHGLYERSVVCVTADHGDEFLEHGGAVHNTKLYNELLHVPLLLKLPDSVAASVVDRKVSLIDLLPTLCEAAGLPPEEAFKGRSLVASAEETPIFSETLSDSRTPWVGIRSAATGPNLAKIACQFRGWKYVVDRSTGTEELYDLASDPGELTSLSLQEVDKLAEMRAQVLEFERTNPPFSLAGADSSMAFAES